MFLFTAVHAQEYKAIDNKLGCAADCGFYDNATQANAHLTPVSLDAHTALGTEFSANLHEAAESTPAFSCH